MEQQLNSCVEPKPFFASEKSVLGKEGIFQADELFATHWLQIYLIQTKSDKCGSLWKSSLGLRHESWQIRTLL